MLGCRGGDLRHPARDCRRSGDTRCADGVARDRVRLDSRGDLDGGGDQHRAVRTARPVRGVIDGSMGLRRVVLGALALLAVSVALTTKMQNQWQLTLLWGVLVGTGTGMTSMVLAAIVANRWFDARRGLVLGILSAANATGQLIFLPLLASLVTARGWRAAALLVSAAASAVFVLVFVLMRDRPEDMGLLPYGRRVGAPPAPRRCRRLRRCAQRSCRARSGFWRGRSSSAARARTV
jgi:MFS family permease